VERAQNVAGIVQSGGERFPECLPRDAWDQRGSGKEEPIGLYQAGGLQGTSVIGILRGVLGFYEDRTLQRVFFARTGVTRPRRRVVTRPLKLLGQAATVAHVVAATIMAGRQGLLDGGEECKEVAGQAATQGRADCGREYQVQG
jgi:hypothetical protein